jgi:GNAT superfamily N-acetyltransferase
MDVVISEIQDDDIHELLKLINNELGYPSVTIEELSTRIAKMKQAGNYFIFKAISKGDVIGFIVVAQEIALEIQNDYFRILELVVSAPHQNKGIGSSLLKHVENLASEKGISFIRLSCAFHRTDAHAFYERNGYAKTSYTFAKGDKHSKKHT